MKIRPTDIGYNRIENHFSIERFFELTKGFHDTLIKEFKVIENAFVDKDNWMIMNFKLNGKLILQSQKIDRDIEILFTGIRRLKWDSMHEIYSGG